MCIRDRLSVLDKGPIKLKINGQFKNFDIDGGIVEVKNNKLRVLIDWFYWICKSIVINLLIIILIILVRNFGSITFCMDNRIFEKLYYLKI